MRILILTPRLPWPPIDGGRVAMSRLSESLVHAGADVRILSLNPRKHRGEPDAPIPLEAVGIDTSRLLAPGFRALSHREPFVVSRFFSRRFDARVRETIRMFQPDVVQIESPFLLPYADSIDRPIVLRSLNVEFRIWEGLAEHETNLLRRIALHRVAGSLRRWELRMLNRVEAVVPISDDDANDFRRLGCTRPMHVIPCGVVLPETPATSGEPGSVGFIGSLDFRPNQEAVRWIVEDLWPRVMAIEPAARLSIAGSSPPPWLQQLREREGIEILGQVADSRLFMERMSVMIAPLFAGSGMRIKVLEAMALGRPVVATALGAGGIAVENGRDILLAEDAGSFAAAVAGLLRDRPAAARIAAAARETVAGRYESDALGRDLRRFYETLA